MAAESQCFEKNLHRTVAPIENRLGQLGNSRSMGVSICKVPNKLRKEDEEAYSPLIVSIGPFHSSSTTGSVLPQTSENKEDHPQTPVNKDHQPAMEEYKWQHMLSLLQQLVKKHDHLLAMEGNKWWYMLYLLQRTQNPQETLKKCGKAVLKLEKFVRGSYAENIKFEPHELAGIMLVDGCFILELFLRSRSRQDVTEEDPIFQNDWMVPTIRRDLALLENQIPFFVLKELFETIAEENKALNASSVTDLALSFFYPDLDVDQGIIREWRSHDRSQAGDSKKPRHLHLLDLLHSFYNLTCSVKDPEDENTSHASDLCLGLLSNPTLAQSHPNDKKSWPFKKCATEFSEAGIKFEFEKGKETHLFRIRFHEGVITIPPLHIDETRKSLLRNLIAFEQCIGGRGHHITSYAILMKSLIRSPLDIKLLEKNDIMKNELGGVEDVLTLFNNISREVVLKDFHFNNLCMRVNEYQKSWWNCHRIIAFVTVRYRRNMAILKRDYFSNPWSLMAFIAALVGLLFTAVQTYCAVFLS
ncbi:hypothetical protein L1049_007343 [Liquidambar formosana]|uniref:Uncharacterized protein n=1 Tax=Liquidambar formosana TaxID=63359 RepID=A0AAP0R2N4_LIQFO